MQWMQHDAIVPTFGAPIAGSTLRFNGRGKHRAESMVQSAWSMATQLNGLRPDEIRETTLFHWERI